MRWPGRSRTPCGPFFRLISATSPTSDYEIILIDNGSAKILGDETRTISPNLEYIYIPPNKSSPNPALAMNRAAALSRTPLLCLMIDGARMLTPGVLSWGIRLLELVPGAMVEVRGWHLGPKWQPESVAEGYNRTLNLSFSNRCVGGKTAIGFLIFRQPARKQNWVSRARLRSRIVSSSAVHSLINSAGSTIATRNLAVDWSTSIFMRAQWPRRIMSGRFSGKAFHQVHGGAATSLSLEGLRLAAVRWDAESYRLRGPLLPVDPAKFILAGHIPSEFQAWLSRKTSLQGA